MIQFKSYITEEEKKGLAAKADKIKHDRMMDRARMRDTVKKNKETK